jgi:UDP-glucose 4-epimerase
MKFFVTGGAGFIGSHFVDWALKKGHQVVAFDDLSTGTEFFLKDAKQNSNFKLVVGDIRENEQVVSAAADFKPDWIVHLAANADLRRGLERPRRDLDYNTIGTWNVLEAARKANCPNFLFSSTGSVYGEPEVFPTPEDCPFPIQTSLYAASKAAGENLISAYCYGYQLNAVVFRFVSILGPRYTHGHVFDFAKKLKTNPNELDILGNGKQLKSYLHINDLMSGLWKIIDTKIQGFQVYNIGHDDALMVDHSIDYICEFLKLKPKRKYSGGERGWIGDSPRIQLLTQKLKGKGWTAENSLKSSVTDTIRYLTENSFLLERD